MKKIQTVVLLRWCYYLLSGFIVFCFCGCYSLSKTQSDTINKFAVSTQAASVAAIEIKKNLDDMVLQTSLLTASTILESAEYKDSIEKAWVNYEMDKKTTGDIEAAYHLLYIYAEMLKALSSPDYFSSLKNSGQKLGEYLDTILVKQKSVTGLKVPSSFGSILSKLISSIGSHRIGHMQRIYLRQILAESDMAIANICTYYEETILPGYKKNHPVNYRNLGSAFIQFHKSLGLSSADEIRYRNYKEFNQYWLDWYKKEMALTQLLTKASSPFTAIRNLHTEMAKKINGSSSWDELLVKANMLNGEMKELYEAIAALK